MKTLLADARATPLALLLLLLFAMPTAACGAGDGSDGVVIGTSADGATSSGDGTISDAANSDAGALSDGGSASGSSGGGSSSGGTSGGTSGASGSSGGIADAGAVQDSGTTSSSSSGTSGSSGTDAGGTDSAWPAGPEDDIKGSDPSKAKYKTCSSLWTCAVTACSLDPKKGCMDVCMNAASTPVLTEFKSFAKCFNHTCHAKVCPTGDKKCLGDCIWGRCAGFAIKCNAENKSGFKTCDTAFACFDTCKGGDAIDCLTTCYQGLSKSAQSDFDAVWNCIGKTAAKDPFAACLPQVLECTSGGQSGKNTCIEMAMCADDCDAKKKPGEDDFACTSKCYAQGTKAAQNEYKKLLSCFVGFDNGTANGKVCSAGLVGCVKPNGKLTCPEIDPCGKKCQKGGKTEGACTFECLQKATKIEATKFVELMVCMGSKCNAKCKGSTDPKCGEKCLQNECKKEMLACLS